MIEIKDTLKAGDIIRNVLIAPFGEYSAEYYDGGTCIERFNVDTINQILDNVEDQERIILDFDHKSELTMDSTAAGWIENLRLDENKGLVADVVVSEKGAEAINGLNYRSTSPAFKSMPDQTLKLLSVALTNKPRFDVPDNVIYNSKHIEDKLTQLLGAANDVIDKLESKIKQLADEIEKQNNLDKLEELSNETKSMNQSNSNQQSDSNANIILNSQVKQFQFNNELEQISNLNGISKINAIKAYYKNKKI